MIHHEISSNEKINNVYVYIVNVDVSIISSFNVSISQVLNQKKKNNCMQLMISEKVILLQLYTYRQYFVEIFVVGIEFAHYSSLKKRVSYYYLFIYSLELKAFATSINVK